MRAQEKEKEERKNWMMKEGESWEEEDREKLVERESVCECNSLPLSNPREFTDCRGEEREVCIDTERQRERCGEGVGAITAEKEIERYRGRERKTERAETEGDSRKRKMTSVLSSRS